MKKYVSAFTLAVVCSAGLAAAQAQSPQQPQPQPQTPPAQAQQPAEPRSTADQPQPASTTLTGCVYREQDVPGRAPNVAERAGVLEDYILAVAPASEQAAAPAATPEAVGTAGAMRSAPMYKLELIADEKLRAVVGKRVEVTGRIDAEAGDTRPGAAAETKTTSEADRAIGRDRVNLPEFEVVSIREVAGTCPAKPSDK